MRFPGPLFHFDGMRVVQAWGIHVAETWARQGIFCNVSLYVNTAVDKSDAWL